MLKIDDNNLVFMKFFWTVCLIRHHYQYTCLRFVIHLFLRCSKFWSTFFCFIKGGKVLKQLKYFMAEARFYKISFQPSIWILTLKSVLNQHLIRIEKVLIGHQMMIYCLCGPVLSQIAPKKCKICTTVEIRCK